MREKTEATYIIENIFCGEKTGNEVYKEFLKKSLDLDELAIDYEKIDSL